MVSLDSGTTLFDYRIAGFICYVQRVLFGYFYIYSKTSLNRSTMVLLGRSVLGVRISLQWYCMSDRSGLKQGDRYREVVDLRKWSIEEVLLYLIECWCI